ncbi:MAG: T9SS type A sorting domain-containing protein [Flavobacteriales bacterium]|nr:T9SS type A sorting domain-containing protein [Flavobacteriales bacterium]
MHRPLLSFLLVTALGASAQFGPIQFAFESEVKYPNRVLVGDVDGDGDMDPITYNSGTGNINTNNLRWFENLGGGAFGAAQVMLTGSIGNSAVLRMRDMDGDGDADLAADGSWYQNDGNGVLTLVGAYSPVGGACMLLRDLDGDGDVDELVRSANGINLLFNNGAGTFNVGPQVGPIGTNTNLRADAADLNGDGLPDLVIGGNNAQTGWYANLGSGTFGEQQSINGFVSPGNPFCGDVDADGDQDLIVFGMTGGTVWFANDGAGNFTSGGTIPTTVLPMAIADFDGDGDVDLTVDTGTSCNVHLLQNQGGQAWTTLAVETVSGYNLVGTKYAAGDLNGDGLEDLVMCSGMDIAAWYPNLGNGSIGPRHRYCQTMAGAFDISAADIDLDGDVDLVTASYHGDWVCWYANNGDGTYGPQQVVVERRNQIAVSRTADLDGDGLPDIITNVADCAIIWNSNGGSSWATDTLPGQGLSRCETDLDGDGDLDLVGTAKWYENDGNGVFTVRDEPLLTTGTVKAADMNGDGVVDLVLLSGTQFTTLLNNGSAGFTQLTAPAVNYGQFALGDLNDDGYPDAAVIVSGIVIRGYYNDGTGVLLDGGVLFTGPAGQPRTILMQDINGDGYNDVVWALSNGYTHQTYYNLGIGNGTLDAANLIDPTAESAAAMVFADLNNDAVPDLVTARFRTISWQENLFFNAFRLRGSVFLDFDLDATLNNEEQKIPYRLVRTNANEVLVWSNSAGDYDLPADTGTWNVWHPHAPIFQVTNDPDTLQATLTTAAPIASGLDIGLAPANLGSGTFFTITPVSTQCNSATYLQITLRNVGTFIPEDIVVDLSLLQGLTVEWYFPQPDSVVNGHVYWSVDSLGWFQEAQFRVGLFTGPAGSTIEYGYVVTGTNIPEPILEPHIIHQVTCAFDPNDKRVSPEGYGVHGAVDVATDWLEYTIRFQNTGNDTAYTVVLVDTLDTDVDPATMEILDVSHALTRIEVDADRVAYFRFDRIMLPDSIVDEPGSHGFLKYRIRPVAGAPHLTEITNSVAIYFDLNEPIITNTVLNTLVDCGLHSASIAPVGPDELLASPVGDAYQWYINGNAVPDGTNATITTDINGDYTVEVTSIYGCVALSEPFSVISTSTGAHTDGQYAVLPNPAVSEAVVYGTRPFAALDVVQLLDMRGRVVRTFTGNGTDRLVVAREGLAPGTYLLRVLGADTNAVVRLTFADQ